MQSTLHPAPAKAPCANGSALSNSQAIVSDFCPRPRPKSFRTLRSRHPFEIAAIVPRHGLKAWYTKPPGAFRARRGMVRSLFRRTPNVNQNRAASPLNFPAGKKVGKVTCDFGRSRFLIGALGTITDNHPELIPKTYFWIPRPCNPGSNFFHEGNGDIQGSFGKNRPSLFCSKQVPFRGRPGGFMVDSRPNWTAVRSIHAGPP